MNIQVPPALEEVVASGRTVLFAGAGISKQALLGGVQLRQLLAKEIRKSYPTYDYRSRKFEQVCEEFEVVYDQARLREFLAQQIDRRTNTTPSHLAAVNVFDYIVTTNWDILFERAYAQQHVHFSLFCDESNARALHYGSRNLIKMHGCIRHPSSIVCTTEDYETYTSKHPEILERVRDLIFEYPVVFVGYDFADSHVHRLLHRIQFRRGANYRRNYVIGLFNHDIRVRWLERKWNMDVIEADAHQLLPLLKRNTLYNPTEEALETREEIWRYVAEILGGKDISDRTAFEMRRSLNRYHLAKMPGGVSVPHVKEMLASVDQEFAGCADISSDEITEEFVAAVMRFQKSCGVAYVDGIVGPNTLDQLQNQAYLTSEVYRL